MNPFRLRRTLLLFGFVSLSCQFVQGALSIPDSGPTPAQISPAADSGTMPASTPLYCAGPEATPVTDLEVRQAPVLSEPAPRSVFRDPVFGTCLVRVTDRKKDIGPDDPSKGMKNEYARVQSFNADGSLLLVRSIEANWYLYDAYTLLPIEQLPLNIEPRWDAVNPEMIYHLDETRLFVYNVGTSENRLVHDFAADFPDQQLAAVWTKHEGSPSYDGRYWGLMAENLNWEAAAFLLYDLQIDRVIAKRDVRGLPGAADIDNAYISPLGNYFIADFSDHYCEYGLLGTDANPCGLMVYDRDLMNGRGLLRISGHMDLVVDSQGREVVVFQEIDTDSISMLDLASGAVTALWPIDFSHAPLGFHFSGRAINRPGWALVSTYGASYPTHFTWMDNEVFAVELKPGGRVVRLAHTGSVFSPGPVSYGEKDYWAEPHASVNQDFTRVLFTSNWGQAGTEEVELYMILLPPGLFN